LSERQRMSGWQLLAILVITTGLGFVSAISGGGTGALVTPGLILIGLSPSHAVAAGRFAGLGVGTGSLWRFVKKNIVDWKWVRILMPISMFLSAAASLIVVDMPKNILENGVALATISVALVLLIDRKAGMKQRNTSRHNKQIGSLIFWTIDFTRFIFASGFSTLNMYVMMRLLGMDALTANATKRAIAFPSLFISISIFIFNGTVEWPVALTLLLGFFLGSQAGAKIAIAKGSKMVRNTLTVVAIVIGFTILFT
jgi:uncharacterized membrane protein YfcA